MKKLIFIIILLTISSAQADFDFTENNKYVVGGEHYLAFEACVEYTPADENGVFQITLYMNESMYIQHIIVNNDVVLTSDSSYYTVFKYTTTEFENILYTFEIGYTYENLFFQPLDYDIVEDCNTETYATVDEGPISPMFFGGFIILPILRLRKR